MNASVLVKFGRIRPLSLVAFFLVVALGLLLMPFESAHDRVIGEFLNIGHIALFGALAVLLLRRVSIIREKSLFMQLCYIALLCAALGVVTEVLQSFTERTPSLRDVGLDIAGGVLAVAFFSRQSAAYQREVRVVTLGMALLLMWPAVSVLSDAWAMQRQFPVLADMSTSNELLRWTAGANSLDREYDEAAQRYRLRATLRVTAFSGFTLEYFKRDWRDYDEIVFDVENPQPQSLAMSIRIHAKAHERGEQHYADRFNYHLTLQPGKQRIAIALKRIESAPRGRKLDLGEVAAMGIFVTGLKKPVALYVDQIRLIKSVRD